MGDSLDGVRLAVGEIIAGVDAPLTPRPMMLGPENPVHDRVAEVHVGRGHVDLGPQCFRAVFKLPIPHLLEQVHVLFYRTLTVRAVFARLDQSPTVLPHLLSGKVAHVSLAVFYQLDCVLENLLEIVRGVEKVVAPIPTQPAHVLHDGVHVLNVLSAGVGVVEAQVADAAFILGGDAEI